MLFLTWKSHELFTKNWIFFLQKLKEILFSPPKTTFFTILHHEKLIRIPTKRLLLWKTFSWGKKGAWSWEFGGMGKVFSFQQEDPQQGEKDLFPPPSSSRTTLTSLIYVLFFQNPSVMCTQLSKKIWVQKKFEIINHNFGCHFH